MRPEPSRREPILVLSDFQGVPLPQSGMKSPRLGAMVGSSLAGAGRGIMPALDYLAARVIGDDPVLTAALQCAPDNRASTQL